MTLHHTGLWYGIQPNFKIFLKEIVQDFKILKSGIEVHLEGPKPILAKLEVIMTILDMPATKKVFLLKSYNGLFGCNFCKNPGHKNGLVRYYFASKDFEPRTPKDFETAYKKETEKDYLGIKGKSVFADLFDNLDPTPLLTLDPMHNSFLGNTLRILKAFLDSSNHKRVFYITPKKQRELDLELRNVKLPAIFHKNVRSIIKDLNFFKADELRIFALYLLPIFKGYIPSNFHNFIDIFNEACTLASSKNPSRDQLDRAKFLFKNVSILGKQLFGLLFATCNMHQNEHIGLCLDKWGPFYNYSAFKYEGLMGTMLKHRHGTYQFHPHLIWMFNLDFYLSEMEFKYHSNLRPDVRKVLSTRNSDIDPNKKFEVADSIFLIGKPAQYRFPGFQLFHKCLWHNYLFWSKDKTQHCRHNSYTIRYTFQQEFREGEILRFLRTVPKLPTEHARSFATVKDFENGKEVSISLEDIVCPLVAVKTSHGFYRKELVGPMWDQLK